MRETNLKLAYTVKIIFALIPILEVPIDSE